MTPFVGLGQVGFDLPRVAAFGESLPSDAEHGLFGKFCAVVVPDPRSASLDDVFHGELRAVVRPVIGFDVVGAVSAGVGAGSVVGEDRDRASG